MPRVVAGLPVRNGGEHLDTALATLLGQSYPAFHLVVSDNGSTDGTRDVLAAWADRDQRVQVVNQPENIGMIPNFNFVLGLDQRDGDLFFWAAYDHEYDDDFAAAAAAVLAGADADVAAAVPTVEVTQSSGATRTVVPDARLADPRPHVRLDAAIRPDGTFVVYSVFRRALAHELGGLTELYPQDSTFLAALALRHRLVPCPAARMRYHHLTAAEKPDRKPHFAVRDIAPAVPYLWEQIRLAVPDGAERLRCRLVLGRALLRPEWRTRLAVSWRLRAQARWRAGRRLRGAAWAAAAVATDPGRMLSWAQGAARP